MLPAFAGPNDFPCSPKREFILEKLQTLSDALTACLLDSAEKTRHLPQGLLFSRLKKYLRPGQSIFIVHDHLEGSPELARNLVDHHLRGLAG